MSALENLYRVTMRKLVQPLVLPRVVSPERRNEAQAQWADFKKTTPSLQNHVRRIWWHAASVGELENLWPVILAMAAQEQKPEFVITILSESARERVEKLKQALAPSGVRILFTGYSPWEGSWGEALELAKPDLFITSKYEAWPELWMSLAAQQIPLIIVGAKARRSLKTCARICRWMGSRFPEMLLLSSSEEDQKELKLLFPKAEVRLGGDPRWDQVRARAQAGNSRAAELKSAMGALPRPWGVLGSAWLSDLEIWKPFLSEVQGTILLVPHKIDSAHIEPLKRFLESTGLSYLQTSQYPTGSDLKQALSAQTRFVLVDEMGFLSELYSAADWAYVGGGFGEGIHSTIEPAIHAIPIACGPARAHQFVEITQLQKTGQLSQLENSEDLSKWLRDFTSPADRTVWTQQISLRFGATDRIVALLMKRLEDLSASRAHVTVCLSPMER